MRYAQNGVRQVNYVLASSVGKSLRYSLVKLQSHTEGACDMYSEALSLEEGEGSPSTSMTAQ